MTWWERLAYRIFGQMAATECPRCCEVVEHPVGAEVICPVCGELIGAGEGAAR